MLLRQRVALFDLRLGNVRCRYPSLATSGDQKNLVGQIYSREGQFGAPTMMGRHSPLSLPSHERACVKEPQLIGSEKNILALTATGCTVGI